jgi:hypothetical protein
VGGVEPGQDPGSVQEIVDQGIDRDQLYADFEPPVPRDNQGETAATIRMRMAPGVV